VQIQLQNQRTQWADSEARPPRTEVNLLETHTWRVITSTADTKEGKRISLIPWKTMNPGHRSNCRFLYSPTEYFDKELQQ